MRYVPTVNDDSLKSGLSVSAGLHVAMFLFLFFGLPHMIPPLPEHHGPIPFDIVTIGDITNTRIGDSQEEKSSSPPPAPQPKAPPAPTPPAPQAKPQPPAPTPPVAKPDQQAEALKPIAKPVPQVKPAPPAPAVTAPAKPQPPQPDLLSSVLKNVAKMKPVDAAPTADAKPVANAQAQSGTGGATGAGTGSGPSFGSRLMITEEDALRRQVEQCWNPPVGARNAQELIVEVMIDVNPDRTVASADIVDKSRYASDPFFRAAADAAVRALHSPKCSPLELSADKYEQWKHIDFTFDPRDML